MRPSRLDLAYIAGFFDGEGCVYGSNISRGKPIVRIKISQKKPEILYWIRDTLGFGNVYDEVTSKSWRTKSNEEVKQFITLVKPYSRGKLDQLEVAEEFTALIGTQGTRPDEANKSRRLELFYELRRLKQ